MTNHAITEIQLEFSSFELSDSMLGYTTFLSVKLWTLPYPSVLTFVLGAQKNGLIETVLLSTLMFWLRNKKIIFWYAACSLNTKGLLDAMYQGVFSLPTFNYPITIWNSVNLDKPSQTTVPFNNTFFLFLRLFGHPITCTFLCFKNLTVYFPTSSIKDTGHKI